MTDFLSLSDKAYHTIRRDILTCRLLPGSLVTESELMERYHTGKSTIRLALARLSHEKLVISRPRKGYRIAPVSVQDVEEVFTVLQAVQARRAP